LDFSSLDGGRRGADDSDLSNMFRSEQIGASPQPPTGLGDV
jgi:hypothetical protein